ncbi:DUF4276 family protein [Amycolatopsis sp. QT-25]|uniref:DUF4276 family protein n=1 Tax=Amycolatopsis sp. QT-25 TaxID=3034022 RepID=UPI0023EB4B9F|nr:DUF4276 family protein [Amycolatopsis sp. QT-25]WET79744.1 DUF4276 family protein [Amycolatopsis sp. QT-25]
MTTGYRRLHILVEGQTEEIVVNNVLEPYLQNQGWMVTKSIVTTKRPATGPASRGGVSSWSKLKNEIMLLLRSSDIHTLTTLFDFYGFPADSPGMNDQPPCGPYDRVQHVERSLTTAISDPRFVPHLILHELETWAFAAAEQLGWLFSGSDLTTLLLKDVRDAGGPELVNDGPNTAPSKRLARYCASYSKTNDGPLAIADLGIEELTAQCPHFAAWLTQLGSRV